MLRRDPERSDYREFCQLDTLLSGDSSCFRSQLFRHDFAISLLATSFHDDIYWLHWATRDLVKFNDYKGHWPEFMSKRLIIPSPEHLFASFGNTIESICARCPHP